MTLPSWIASALHLVSTAVLVYTVGVFVVLASSRRAAALRDVLAAGAVASLGTLGCMAAFGHAVADAPSGVCRRARAAAVPGPACRCGVGDAARRIAAPDQTGPPAGVGPRRC